MVNFLQAIAIIWVVIGVYYWIKMPDQEFELFDILIGLPLCILFWPRVRRI